MPITSVRVHRNLFCNIKWLRTLSLADRAEAEVARDTTAGAFNATSGGRKSLHRRSCFQQLHQPSDVRLSCSVSPPPEITEAFDQACDSLPSDDETVTFILKPKDQSDGQL